MACARLHRSVLLALILTVAPACGDGGEGGGLGTVADIVTADARLGLLADALAQEELLGVLDGAGPITLLAPTDPAFDAFAVDQGLTVAQVLASDELRDLLRYHVVAGRFGRAELSQVSAVVTLAGTAVRVELDGDRIVLNDEVQVALESIEASNGLVHVLHAVLTQPLITTTKQYVSRPDVALEDPIAPGFPARTSDSIVVDDTGFVREMQVQLNIRHPSVAELSVALEHVDSGTVLALVGGLGTRLDDVQVELSDSAPLDVVDDAMRGNDDAQALPAATYRPLEPLEFAFGEAIEGEWVLHVDDARSEQSGRLISWGMTLTFSEERPAPALAFARPRSFRGLLPQGFTEVVPLRIKRLAGLQGPVTLTVDSGAGIDVPPVEIDALDDDADVFFAVGADAALGQRVIEFAASAGGVRRSLGLVGNVVEVDRDGVELLAHVPLAALGASGGAGNDLWGWTDPVSGVEYALIGSSFGTTFVDIRDPAKPVVLGMLPTHTFASLWRDIKVYRDHAFIVSEAANHGMQVFDLTQLRDVTAPQTFTATAHHDSFGNAHNIAINEESGFAYVVGADDPEYASTCFGGLLMVDITTPTAPVFAGCFAGGVPAGQEPGASFPADAYAHDVQCVTYRGPDEDYVGRELCVGSDGQVTSFDNYLAIADVTDKDAPAQVARISYAGAGYAHQGWLTEDHQYFLLNDEFDEFFSADNTRSYVFDVRDLDAPVLVGVFENPRDAVGHNTYIVGNRAYQANYTSGLRIVDVSNIDTADLVEIAYFDTRPEDDAADDGGTPNARRCAASDTANLWHPTDGESGCGNASFQGAWSNYPYFASGVIAISDIERGLFLVRTTD